MEQRNSGVNLEIWDNTNQIWIQIKDMFFQEASTYRWRTSFIEPFSLLIQDIPLPMTKCDSGWTGTIETPFQSGKVLFKILANEIQEIEQFVFTDERKMLVNDYQQMISDILQEGMICFQAEGLQWDVKASGRLTKPSYLQWQYIKNNIVQLRSIFRLIDKKPLRMLQQEEKFLKREQVKAVNQRTATWIERYGERYGWTPKKMPNHIQTTVVKETYQTYENKVILTHLLRLRNQLAQYKSSGYPEIEREAEKYLDWTYSWKERSFLKNVTPYTGSILTSQVFRKHPYYREWFKWIQALNDFEKVSFDMDQSISIKDTYDIYEIWAYLQIIKALRELELVENYQGLFFKEDDLFFLSLAQNRQSKVKLKNGGYLTFQRIIQSNSNPFYTFTQRMIPDITIEHNNQMVILDPKYRVDSNIPSAVAEMHKYKDGILDRETKIPVVSAAYILTPSQGTYSIEKDFYTQEYHDKYKMGAFMLCPGCPSNELKDWLKSLFKQD